MLPLGMILGFVSYGVGTWGYILVKGYNVTLAEWFSPLHPFTGALDSNGMVPTGSIFPTKGKGAAASTGGSTTGQQQQKAAGVAQKQNRPVPQGPGSRL